MLQKVILILAAVCCITAATNNPACRRDTQSCLNHLDCCSKTCYLNTCYSLDQIVFPFEDLGSVPRDINLAEISKGEDKPKVETPTIPQELEISHRAGTPTTDRALCKQIAQKCHSHDECCTKRCHGYLHKCVM